MAAPIVDWNGVNIAAPAIVLPTVRIPEDIRTKYASLLVDAAKEISKTITKP